MVIKDCFNLLRVSTPMLWTVALMVGYVRNDCHQTKGLAGLLSTQSTQSKYKTNGRLDEMYGPNDSHYEPQVYLSKHRRIKKIKAKGKKAKNEKLPPITVHHLWLRPEKPCPTPEGKTSSKCSGCRCQ